MGHLNTADKSAAYGAKGPGFKTRWRQEFIYLNCMVCSFDQIKFWLGLTFKKPVSSPWKWYLPVLFQFILNVLITKKDWPSKSEVSLKNMTYIFSGKKIFSCLKCGSMFLAGIPHCIWGLQWNVTPLLGDFGGRAGFYILSRESPLSLLLLGVVLFSCTSNIPMWALSFYQLLEGV